MKNKKAFTLVELLAVIVILAVILVIAVPQVLDVIDTTKVGSLESSAKLIASTAEKKYAEYLALGKNTGTIKCSDVTKLNYKDYGLCTISFDENGKATVSIKGKENGKFEGLKCSGTKDNISCKEIPVLPIVDCTFTAKVYTVKDYDACMTYLKSTVPEEELTDEILNLADSICKGNGIPENGESTSEIFEGMISGSTEIEQELIDLDVINIEETSVFELKPGIEYVNGQYTYRYKQQGSYRTLASGIIFDWYDMNNDGWGVTLTDKESTNPVTSEVCTYINGQPVVSMSYMFYQSKASGIDLTKFNTSNIINMFGMFDGSVATSLDLSNFDTSNVTNMSDMFGRSAATSLDLSNFDTSNVTNMGGMFSGSAVTSLDLSGFDTSNVTDMDFMFGSSKATSLDLSNFNTSNVTSMFGMFMNSAAISLDLSSFDTSKVTDMSQMFLGSAATSLDLSSFNTSNVTRMVWMFSGSAATSLDLSNFDTSNVTDMSEMFDDSAATSLDLSSFNTSNVTDMRNMFNRSAATSLDLSSFDTSNVRYMSQMFSDCTATTGYARTQADADKFNSSFDKPRTLTFVVKQ